MKNPLNKKPAKPKQPKQNKPSLLSQLTSKKGSKPKSNAQKPATTKTGNGLLDKLRGKKAVANPSAPSAQTPLPQAKAKKGLSLPSLGKKQPNTKSTHASQTTAKSNNNSLQQFLATKGRFLVFGIIVLIVLLLAYVLASKFLLNNDEQNISVSEPSVPVEANNVPADNNTTDDTANDVADDTAAVAPEDSAATPSETTAEATSDANIDTNVDTNVNTNTQDDAAAVSTAEDDERHAETQSQIANALKGVTPGDTKRRGGNISYDEFVKESKNKIYVEEGKRSE